MKKYISLCFSVMALFLLASCGGGQTVKIDKSISSTDLSGIRIDSVSIGMPIQDIDFTAYTETDRAGENENEHHFEEISFFTDENSHIVKVQLILSYLKFSIDGNSEIRFLDEVTDLLGSHYHEYWFDREQGLKAHTYCDRENGRSATFVYSIDEPNTLVWFILEKL